SEKPSAGLTLAPGSGWLATGWTGFVSCGPGRAGFTLAVTRRRDLLAFRKGIIAGVKLYANRSTAQFESLPKSLLQIANIAGRHFIGLIAVNHYNGGIIATGMSIAQFYPVATHHGRLVFANGRLQ